MNIKWAPAIKKQTQDKNVEPFVGTHYAEVVKFKFEVYGKNFNILIDTINDQTVQSTLRSCIVESENAAALKDILRILRSNNHLCTDLSNYKYDLELCIFLTEANTRLLKKIVEFEASQEYKAPSRTSAIYYWTSRQCSASAQKFVLSMF